VTLLRAVRQAHKTASNFNEAVRGERLRRFLVECAPSPGPLGNECQRPGAALSERAFEAALFPKRFVAAAS
jgi:hypothetical protein